MRGAELKWKSYKLDTIIHNVDTQSPSLKETTMVIVAIKRFLRFLITPSKWFVRDEPVHVICQAKICLRIFIFTLSVRLLNYPKLASKEGFHW